jgi:hypothetical protein
MSNETTIIISSEKCEAACIKAAKNLEHELSLHRQIQEKKLQEYIDKKTKTTGWKIIDFCFPPSTKETAELEYYDECHFQNVGFSLLQTKIIEEIENVHLIKNMCKHSLYITLAKKDFKLIGKFL